MHKLFAFEKSVGAVVFRREAGKVLYLLLQYRSWQWDFPKGHIEQGENEQQTLRREILEETGISEISILSNFRQSAWYFYRARGNEKIERLEKGRGINIFKLAVLYAVEVQGAEIKLDFESKAFVWLDFDKG